MYFIFYYITVIFSTQAYLNILIKKFNFSARGKTWKLVFYNQYIGEKQCLMFSYSAYMVMFESQHCV